MFFASYRNTEAGYAKRTAAQRMEANRLRVEERLHQERLLAEKVAQAERERQERIEARLIHLSKQIELFKAAVDREEFERIRYRPTYRRIQNRACKVFRVSVVEIRSNRRNKEVVFARHFIMYWAVRLTVLSLPQIGKLMGGMDHTTILHGKRAYVEKRALMGRKLKAAR